MIVCPIRSLAHVPVCEVRVRVLPKLLMLPAALHDFVIAKDYEILASAREFILRLCLNAEGDDDGDDDC
jgi:hypothetical protein